MLTVHCPSCGQALRLSERHLGVRGKCRKCAEPIVADVDDESGLARAVLFADYQASQAIATPIESARTEWTPFEMATANPQRLSPMSSSQFPSIEPESPFGSLEENLPVAPSAEPSEVRAEEGEKEGDSPTAAPPESKEEGFSTDAVADSRDEAAIIEKPKTVSKSGAPPLAGLPGMAAFPKREDAFSPASEPGSESESEQADSEGGSKPEADLQEDETVPQFSQSIANSPSTSSASSQPWMESLTSMGEGPMESEPTDKISAEETPVVPGIADLPSIEKPSLEEPEVAEAEPKSEEIAPAASSAKPWEAFAAAATSEAKAQNAEAEDSVDPAEGQDESKPGAEDKSEVTSEAASSAPATGNQFAAFAAAAASMASATAAAGGEKKSEVPSSDLDDESAKPKDALGAFSSSFSPPVSGEAAAALDEGKPTDEVKEEEKATEENPIADESSSDLGEGGLPWGASKRPALKPGPSAAKKEEAEAKAIAEPEPADAPKGQTDFDPSSMVSPLKEKPGAGKTEVGGLPGASSISSSSAATSEVDSPPAAPSEKAPGIGGADPSIAAVPTDNKVRDKRQRKESRRRKLALVFLLLLAGGVGSLMFIKPGMHPKSIAAGVKTAWVEGMGQVKAGDGIDKDKILAPLIELWTRQEAPADDSTALASADPETDGSDVPPTDAAAETPSTVVAAAIPAADQPPASPAPAQPHDTAPVTPAVAPAAADTPPQTSGASTGDGALTRAIPGEDEETRRVRLAGESLLKQFYAARSAEEKLGLVLSPGQVATDLEEAYPSPVEVPSIRSMSFKGKLVDSATQRPFGVFDIRENENGDRHRWCVPEMSPGEFKVDWVLYRQLADDELTSFLANPEAPPGTFRLLLRRGPIVAEAERPWNEETLEMHLLMPLDDGGPSRVMITRSAHETLGFGKELGDGAARVGVVQLDWVESQAQPGKKVPTITAVERWGAWE